MKKFVCSALMVVAGMLLVTTAQCQPVVVELEIETQLDLDDHFIGPDVVADHRDKFNARFKCDDALNDFDMTALPLKIGDIKSVLYSRAKNALKSNPNACSNNRCVTGVKITLGLENNSVVYFFQPLYMIQASPGSTSFSVQYIEPGVYWRSVNGSLSQATDLSPMTAYLNRVRINRFRNNGDFDHALQYPGDGIWKGDTKGIIYTFQEMLEVHNKGYGTKSDDMMDDEPLLFHNGAALFRRWSADFLQRWRAKHLVYLTAGPRGNEKAVINRSPDHSAANFAHLCPPSCQDLDYELK